MTGRFDRHIALFGEEGQRRIGASHVAVVGAGGLGSHVLQQLALLGVARLTAIDSEELAESNRNRYVSARFDDRIPGTLKVAIAERMIKAIDPSIRVDTVADSLVSEAAFTAICSADYVFGCLDSEGARLLLNELCAAYVRPYIDLASDVLPGNAPEYGGRICANLWAENGCLVCRGLIDLDEAQLELAGPQAQRDHDALYGVPATALGRSGPSVVSINGVVSSLAVTEFMVAVTGLRSPKPVLVFRGGMGRLTGPTDNPTPDCFYCVTVRGGGDAADVQRYIRNGVGEFLR